MQNLRPHPDPLNENLHSDKCSSLQAGELKGREALA